MHFQSLPASVLPHRMHFFVGIVAYTVLGDDGAKPILTRSVGSVVGRPPPTLFQVRPPSVDFQMPPSVLPLSSVHGLRCMVHMPASRTFGFEGSIWMSLAPVVSLTYSTFFQFLPPSVVMNTPRVSLGFHGLPSTATYTVFGSCGLTTMLEISPASFSPLNCQVLPSSGEKYTPWPISTSLRGLASPVPTQMSFGLEGASATAPMEAASSCLNTLSHLMPSSVVFHNPAPAVPT